MVMTTEAFARRVGWWSRTQSAPLRIHRRSHPTIGRGHGHAPIRPIYLWGGTNKHMFTTLRRHIPQTQVVASTRCVAMWRMLVGHEVMRSLGYSVMRLWSYYITSPGY